MNQKIGMIGSIINLLAVISFALNMIIGTSYGSYLSSTFITLGFMLMIAGFASFADAKSKAASYVALGFAACYMMLIFVVYYTQMTTVQFDELTQQAARILDYQNFGLMFTLDLLGYFMMAVSTFFISFTLDVKTKAEQWLKWLLRIHGVFALSCFIIPLLNVFKASDSSNMTGVCLLEFWCAYFIPVGILSFIYFRKKESK